MSILTQIHEATVKFVRENNRPPKYIKLNIYQIEQLKHVFPRSTWINDDRIIVRPGDSFCGLTIVKDNTIDIPLAE